MLIIMLDIQKILLVHKDSIGIIWSIMQIIIWIISVCIAYKAFIFSRKAPVICLEFSDWKRLLHNQWDANLHCAKVIIKKLWLKENFFYYNDEVDYRNMCQRLADICNKKQFVLWDLMIWSKIVINNLILWNENIMIYEPSDPQTIEIYNKTYKAYQAYCNRSYEEYRASCNMSYQAYQLQAMNNNIPLYEYAAGEEEQEKEWNQNTIDSIAKIHLLVSWDNYKIHDIIYQK